MDVVDEKTKLQVCEDEIDAQKRCNAALKRENKQTMNMLSKTQKDLRKAVQQNKALLEELANLKDKYNRDSSCAWKCIHLLNARLDSMVASIECSSPSTYSPYMQHSVSKR